MPFLLGISIHREGPLPFIKPRPQSACVAKQKLFLCPEVFDRLSQIHDVAVLNKNINCFFVQSYYERGLSNVLSRLQYADIVLVRSIKFHSSET
jgi:hypothetical protein